MVDRWGGRLVLVLFDGGDWQRLRWVQQAAFFQHLAADLVHQRRVVAQELLGVLPALAQADVAVVEPGAALVDELVLDGQVEQVAFAADAAVVHQVELGLAERRRDLVLDHLAP